jgi:hypothetical protein
MWNNNTKRDQQCLRETDFSHYIACMKIGQARWDTYAKTYIWPASHSFRVMTKAELIDQLVPLMDFALFDPELAKKKDTEIEEKE